MTSTPRSGLLLIVTTGIAFGGAEVQLVELAERLCRRGWRVHIASMLAPTAFLERLAAAGVTVHTLGMRRGIGDPRAVVRLARLVRSLRPDVVHSHMVHANLLARVTRCVAPMSTLICTAHSIDEGGRLREIAYGLTDRLASITTNICAAGVERYIAVGASTTGRIRHVPNGIDFTRFAPDPAARAVTRAALGIDEDTFVWMCTGRMEPVKQHLTLVDAAARLPHASRWQLLHAGSGPLAHEVQARIDSRQLAHRVSLLGLRRDIPALLAAADGFVLSSRVEGLSLALLEAAAVGLPIVTTDVGGCREIVRDGETGWLVHSGDAECTARGLSDAMTHLMTLPATLRHTMGEAARTHALATYDIERVVDQWEALYAEMESLRRESRSAA
jgi:glycosyltransferase involved in cell wall biosynthesis